MFIMVENNVHQKYERHEKSGSGVHSEPLPACPARVQSLLNTGLCIFYYRNKNMRETL